MERHEIRLQLYIAITAMLLIFTAITFHTIFYSNDAVKVELARHYFEVLLSFWVGTLTRFL